MSARAVKRSTGQHRWAPNLVVLAGFALTGTALGTMLPIAAVALTFVVATFVGLVVGGMTRDSRAGVVFGASVVVFAGAAMTYGPALASAVPL